jgi:hypothetical protein
MIIGPTFVSKAPFILIFRTEISHKFIVKIEATRPLEMLEHISGVHNYQVAAETEFSTAALNAFGS